MQDFLIRILDENQAPYLSFTRALLSTHSAVAAAIRVARGRPFEIWCGGRCVYTSNPTARSPQPPGLAA